MQRTILSLLAAAGTLAAQPVVAPTPDRPDKAQETAGYSISNSFETGYRFASIDGNEDVYRSAVNFGNGVRLFEGRLRIHSLDGEGSIDEFSFYTMGAGTDPYQSHTLRAEKKGLYRYDMQFRVNRYRNRLPALWQGEHGIDAERRFQNHELTLLPGSRTEIILGYDRNAQDGPGFSSNGIPSSIGAFDSSNFLRLTTDLRRRNNNYRVGTNLRFAGLALTAFQSLDNYKEDTLYGNGFGLPTQATNVQPISALTRSEPFHGNTPVTTVALRTDKERWIGFHGRFVYSKGERNWALSESATAVSSDAAQSTLRQTFLVGDASRAQTSGDFTVTLLPSMKWTVTNTTAVSSTRITGGASFLEVTQFTNQFLEFEDLGIRHVTNATEVNFRPVKQVGLYGAYRLSERRVETRTAFEFPSFEFEEPLAGVDNTVHTGAGGIRLMPAKGIRASFDAEVGRADQPLTPTSNKNFHNESVRFQWRGNGTTLTAHFKNRINNNPTALVEYSSETRTAGFQASWSRPDGLVTIDGGYTFLAADSSAGVFNLLSTATPEEFPLRTVYTSNLHTANFGGRFQPHERVTAYVGYSLAKDTGDDFDRPVLPERVLSAYPTFSLERSTFFVSFPLTYQSPQARLSVQLNERLAWNFGWQLYDYAERFTGLQDYSAHVGYSSFRWTF